VSRSRIALRRAQRVAAVAERGVRVVTAPVRASQFPYRAPSVPRGVVVPHDPPRLGADYDTGWARTQVARLARGAIVEGPMRLVARVVADPDVHGLDRLADLARTRRTPGDDRPPPVIFAPTHHSHLDTGLMIRAVPSAWRHDLVVAAAADYFFDAHWKAALSALALNAIPIDREATGRKSAELLRDLLADGQSVVIYPEGGRSPDGWGQSFKGGAAYLSIRSGAPVVPVFIDGTGAIYGKGMKRPKPGRTRIVFGAPITPEPDESTRRFTARIEAAVRVLGDEAATDYWSARQRAARGETPTLTGPSSAGWRRQWALTSHRAAGIGGWKRRPDRRWPDLGR
jgi:1-acyl-sn-glycerol-3-phosphate acyltransferase